MIRVRTSLDYEISQIEAIGQAVGQGLNVKVLVSPPTCLLLIHRCPIE